MRGLKNIDPFFFSPAPDKYYYSIYKERTTQFTEIMIRTRNLIIVITIKVYNLLTYGGGVFIYIYLYTHARHFFTSRYRVAHFGDRWPVRF